MAKKTLIMERNFLEINTDRERSFFPCNFSQKKLGEDDLNIEEVSS